MNKIFGIPAQALELTAFVIVTIIGLVAVTDALWNRAYVWAFFIILFTVAIDVWLYRLMVGV